GLTNQELDDFAPRFEEALRSTTSAARDGALGFWTLGDGEALASEIERLRARLPGFREVIVLGIGGSSLGGRSILQALRGPAELAEPAPGEPRVHFPDNSDPFLLRALFEKLAPEHTLFIAISKSGGTVETAAALLLARAYLREA